jgi:predicted metal-dependent hydrolase
VHGEVVVSGASPSARGAALQRWYRREARRQLLRATEAHAVRLGTEFRSVTVRDTRTRWGSCSAQGNLSFSWRLVLAPESVLEYVVVHELCHIDVPNHSKAFWRHMEAAMPAWRGPAAWLKRHATALHAYELTPDA